MTITIRVKKETHQKITEIRNMLSRKHIMTRNIEIVDTAINILYLIVVKEKRIPDDLGYMIVEHDKELLRKLEEWTRIFY